MINDLNDTNSTAPVFEIHALAAHTLHTIDCDIFNEDRKRSTTKYSALSGNITCQNMFCCVCLPNIMETHWPGG